MLWLWIDYPAMVIDIVDADAETDPGADISMTHRNVGSIMTFQRIAIPEPGQRNVGAWVNLSSACTGGVG